MSLLQAKPQRQTNLQGSSRGKGLDIPEISFNACHTPGDYSTKTERAIPPRGPTLLYNIFDGKGTPLVYLPKKNSRHFLIKRKRKEKQGWYILRSRSELFRLLATSHTLPLFYDTYVISRAYAWVKITRRWKSTLSYIWTTTRREPRNYADFLAWKFSSNASRCFWEFQVISG